MKLHPILLWVDDLREQGQFLRPASAPDGRWAAENARRGIYTLDQFRAAYSAPKLHERKCEWCGRKPQGALSACAEHKDLSEDL